MRSILVVTDLSSSEVDVAVRRAAQLARAHNATLKLMYLPSGQAAPADDVAKQLMRLSRELKEEWQLRTRPLGCLARKLRDVASEARDSDLVVFPDRRDARPASFFFGQPVERLIKACPRPVLLARTAPRTRYGRILIGVDFTDRSKALLKFAADLAPHAELELFHATDTYGEAYLKSAEVSEDAIRDYRASRFRAAQEKIVRLTDTFQARRNRVQTALGRGDAARQIVVQQEHTRADLVVLGADRIPALIRLLVGGVADRVLARAGSDVLVMPAAAERSTPTVPVGRLTALRWKSAGSDPQRSFRNDQSRRFRIAALNSEHHLHAHGADSKATGDSARDVRFMAAVGVALGGLAATLLI